MTYVGLNSFTLDYRSFRVATNFPRFWKFGTGSCTVTASTERFTVLPSFVAEVKQAAAISINGTQRYQVSSRKVCCTGVLVLWIIAVHIATTVFCYNVALSQLLI